MMIIFGTFVLKCGILHLDFYFGQRKTNMTQKDMKTTAKKKVSFEEL